MKKRNKDTTSSPLFSDLPPGSLRVLQISDTHLFADTTRRLVGLDTEGSLQEILALIQQRVLPVDVILATGDLTHDASVAAYQRLGRHLQTLGAPVYYLPGNHDDSRVMAEYLANDNISMPAAARHGDWLLIMLDSSLPDSARGHLASAELEKLETGLRNHPECHALVCLHHHPLPSGSSWLDKMSLDNADEFFEIVDRHRNVRGIVWGHIHQPSDSERNGVRMLSIPSTCIQFAPGQAAFGIADTPPGIRWLALLPDGTIRTGIEYLAAVPSGLDLRSAGYK